MAPLKRKRPQDEAPLASTPAPEVNTRRATRQTSIAPLPIQPDPEPRKRRRRADTNEDDELAEPSSPPKSSKAKPTTQWTPPGIRGKENIPQMLVSKPDAARQTRQPPRNAAALMTPTLTSGIKSNGLQPTASTRQASSVLHPRPISTPKATHLQPQQHKLGATKPITIATSGLQPLPTSNLHYLASPSSASPQITRIATKPSADRNVDKVVLGDICFRAWYPSYYNKEVLGGDATTATHSSLHTQSSDNNAAAAHHSSATSSSKDGSNSQAATGNGGNHHARQHRGGDNPPPMLDRLYICPRCFKYSTELVKWWEHVRICEATGHIPGQKIYTHPKGSRVVSKLAPGLAPAVRNAKGAKKGGAAVKMVEEVVHDQGEWSIWEVDGEKDVLFCQNLSLFAKLFLDNKSVFFDVTGFNYFLLVYTPPTPPSSILPATLMPTPTASPDTPTPQPAVPPRPTHPRIVGFFSKEKLSWDNNNLACILVFPPWQRKGLGSLLMGVSYEISRREGVMGGPEKPISDLGRKGYKRFWAGEVARWLLSLDTKEGGKGEGKAASEGDAVAVTDVETCSRETWIAPEDCLAVLREMGVVEDAGKGVDPRTVKARETGEGEGGKEDGKEDGKEKEKEGEEVKMVERVRINKETVRRWVAANGISLERTCDPRGFVDGYAMKAVEEEEGEE